MSNCKHCGEPIPDNPNRRRKRIFCDNGDKCKLAFYAAQGEKPQKRVNIGTYEKVLATSIPKEYLPFQKVAILKEDGTTEIIGNVTEHGIKWLKFSNEIVKSDAKASINELNASNSADNQKDDAYTQKEKEGLKGAEKHELWKEGDPKENSGAFYLKYGYMTYDEIKNSKN